MSTPTPKEIMIGFEAARARTFVYMAEALISELGETRGKEVIRETVYQMSRERGEASRKGYEKRGVSNSWENHRAENGPVYSVAWIGGTTENKPDRKVIEYSYCPLGDAFPKMGERADELGDIYCELVDDAFWAGFKPEWRVKREKTFSRDGVCRLIWTRGSSS